MTNVADHTTAPQFSRIGLQSNAEIDSYSLRHRQHEQQQRHSVSVKQLSTVESVDELYRKWCIDSSTGNTRPPVAAAADATPSSTKRLSTLQHRQNETSLSAMGTPTMMMMSPSSILFSSTSATSITPGHSSAFRHHYHHQEEVASLRGKTTSTPVARELNAASRALTDRIHFLEESSLHQNSLYVPSISQQLQEQQKQRRSGTGEGIMEDVMRAPTTTTAAPAPAATTGRQRGYSSSSNLSAPEYLTNINDDDDSFVGAHQQWKDTTAEGHRKSSHPPTANMATTSSFLAEQVAALHRDNEGLQRHFLQSTQRSDEAHTAALQAMRDRHRRTELQWIEELELHKVRSAALESSLKDARTTLALRQSRIDELSLTLERDKAHSEARERELLMTIGGLQRDLTLARLRSSSSPPASSTSPTNAGGRGEWDNRPQSRRMDEDRSVSPPPAARVRTTRDEDEEDDGRVSTSSPPNSPALQVMSANTQRLQLLRASSAISSGDVAGVGGSPRHSPLLFSEADLLDDVVAEDVDEIGLNKTPSQQRGHIAAASETATTTATEQRVIAVEDRRQQFSTALVPTPQSPEATDPQTLPPASAAHRNEQTPSTAHVLRHDVPPHGGGVDTQREAEDNNNRSDDHHSCPHCAKNQRRLERARAELLESTQQWSCIAEEVADFASAVLRGVRRETSQVVGGGDDA